MELTNERRRRASGALQVHPRPRFACPSFAGHPCDLTLRPTQQASPHALASVPTAIRSPVGRCPESAAEYVELTQPRLNCLADLSGHTVHTVSGACGGPHYHVQHSLWVDVCFDILTFGSRGMARGAALLETKSDLQAMAVRGLQFRGPGAALEQSCRRLKFEQARTNAQ